VNVEGGGVGQVETETGTASSTITTKEVVSIGPMDGIHATHRARAASAIRRGRTKPRLELWQREVQRERRPGRVQHLRGRWQRRTQHGTEWRRSTLMVYPSLDAIQEVKVITANYGAQYGRTASGTVQVTTKSERRSGTETSTTLSATKAFNSRNYFDVVYTQPTPPGQTTPGRSLGTMLRCTGGRISEEPSVGRSTFPTSSTPQRTRRFLLLGGISAGENAYRVHEAVPGFEGARPAPDFAGAATEPADGPRDGSLFPGFSTLPTCAGEHHRLRSLTVPRLPVAAEPGGGGS